MAWKLYTDASLDTEFTNPLSVIHRTDLGDNPQTFTFYFGNREDDPGDNQIIQKQAASAPGTDQITLTVEDANPGSGHDVGEITLALSEADLDTNTAGASLDLGTQLLSGASEAVEIWVRVENSVTDVGTRQELSVDINATVDSDVV